MDEKSTGTHPSVKVADVLLAGTTVNGFWERIAQMTRQSVQSVPANPLTVTLVRPTERL